LWPSGHAERPVGARRASRRLGACEETPRGQPASPCPAFLDADPRGERPGKRRGATPRPERGDGRLRGTARRPRSDGSRPLVRRTGYGEHSPGTRRATPRRVPSGPPARRERLLGPRRRSGLRWPCDRTGAAVEVDAVRRPTQGHGKVASRPPWGHWVTIGGELGRLAHQLHRPSWGKCPSPLLPVGDPRRRS